VIEKFAMRRGNVVLLASILVTAPSVGVGSPVVVVGGDDCNDIDPNIHPGHAEMFGNRIDDDCDGIADEDAEGNPPNDVGDHDTDGVTLGAGDCNDTNPSVRLGAAELQDNLIDDDCDGIADEDAGGNPSADSLDHDGDGFTIAPDLVFYSGFEAAAR
jgi:putative metal-binding protein